MSTVTPGSRTATKRETGWTTVRNKSGDYYRVAVEIEVDFAKIMQKLASKAAGSKRDMATAMHGAIIVKTRKA